MTDCSEIYFRKLDHFSWIRCVGKGNFLNSAALKECAEKCLLAGERCIVVDLEACTGMDSTFMGMLAGLAMRLTKQNGGGRLEIAYAGEKNLQSLEDLGLDALIEINPSSALWQGKGEVIRSELQPWVKGGKVTARERGEHVLETHKILSAASEENAKKFESVVNLLEKELGGQP